MISFIQALPDLVRLVLFILKALRDIGEARDRAVLIEKIKKAVQHADSTKDTSLIEDIINK